MRGGKNNRVTLNPGEYALISGTGQLYVDRGLIEIFGAVFPGGSKVRIRPGKQFPVHAPDEVTSVSSKGPLLASLVKGDPIPRSWRLLPELFLGRTMPKLMIVGPTDSGKSSLTTYLVNISLTMSNRIAVIDSDPGQGDIGPPTCVSGAMTRSRLIDLRELRPIVVEFVGVTSPSALPEGCISAVSRVADSLFDFGVDYMFINTDGWVDDGGVEYKRRLMEVTGPDIVVLLGLKDRAREFEERTNARVVCVDVPDHVFVRSASVRYRARVFNVLRCIGRPKKILVDEGTARSLDATAEPGLIVALYEGGKFKSLGVFVSRDSSGGAWMYSGADSFDEIAVSRVSVPELLAILKEREQGEVSR